MSEESTGNIPSATQAPTEQPAPTREPPRHRQSFLRFFDTSFRNVWFYVAAVALVVNLGYTFRPQIQVQTASFSQKNPLGTYFTIINSGPWTLYNVDMICTLYNGRTKSIKLEDNSFVRQNGAPTGNAIISELEPGRSATRDCGGGGGGIIVNGIPMSSLRIGIDVKYDWIRKGYEHQPYTLFFNTRPIEDNQFVLVPDVETGFPANPSS